MAHVDPGLHNWLDTQGFEQGILAFRTMMASAGPLIDTRTVPVSELAEELPADTAVWATPTSVSPSCGSASGRSSASV